VANNKAVLITGASSGIGCETALLLAERGFRVFATMRDLSRRAKLDEEARSRGVQVQVLQLEITDAASVKAAVEAVVAQAGGLFGLVNNAGVQLRGYFEDLSEPEIRQNFEANVFGTMAVTRAVLPHLRAAGQGRIVVLSSIAGRIGSLGLSSYCACKFALEGFAESLAPEVAPLGIRVSLVEPGIVGTDLWGANRGLGQGALNPQSPYHAWFQEFERLTDWAVRTSPTKPRHVAEAVHLALSSPNPRLRYAVGRRASGLMKLQRLLPERVFQRLYFQTLQNKVTKPSARS
jgi:NAD(P)-dependent dehydrogenase (short-subunit alcohol dehydrogenase family)